MGGKRDKKKKDPEKKALQRAAKEAKADKKAAKRIVKVEAREKGEGRENRSSSSPGAAKAGRTGGAVETATSTIWTPSSLRTPRGRPS